jgi:hypothetical protein
MADEKTGGMWADKDDFFASMEAGIKVLEESGVGPGPHADDVGGLKNLLAASVVATAKHDDTFGHSPEWVLQVDSLKMAILAAYNMGRARK